MSEQTKKVEIGCPKCGTEISVIHDTNVKVECPNCRTKLITDDDWHSSGDDSVYDFFFVEETE